MALSPETITKAVEAASSAVHFVISFFSARVSADKRAVQYNRAKNSTRLWEYLDKELTRVGNGHDLAAAGLKATFEDFWASFADYEKEVKKWHQCVGSDFSDDADGNPRQTKGSEYESEATESDGRERLRRKRIAPINRAMYVLSGKKKISRYAAQYEKKQVILFAQVVAMSLALGRVDTPKMPQAPGGIPALIRFIALAKKRIETNADISIIRGADVLQYDKTTTIIDPNTAFTRLSELAIQRGDLHPAEGYETISGLQTYNDCIVVTRCGGDLQESLNLARLFAEDSADKFSRGFFADPPDGAMLRCCAVLLRNAECDLFFRTPEGCTFQTLRQLLPKSKCSFSLVPKVDRLKFSIRVATAVLVVHSLGLVHKRIHPETILVAQKQLHLGENPRRLGFPYLAAFQGARSDIGVTLKKSDVDGYKLRGIYFHPRDQSESEYRTERYTMEDDIYSLGVCLFEISLWRSLLVWDDKISDYIYDDSFIPLSDNHAWFGTTVKEKARAKLELLVRETRTRVRKALGRKFAEVVESCLTVGYDSNPFKHEYNAFRDEDSDDPVAWKYLQLVLSKLRDIHESFEK